MFNKYSSGNKPDRFRNPQLINRDKEKDMIDKLSRIEESYVDAAIRAVRRKFSGRRSLGFEG